MSKFAANCSILALSKISLQDVLNVLIYILPHNFIQDNHDMARTLQLLRSMQLLKLIQLLQMTKIFTEYAAHLR